MRKDPATAAAERVVGDLISAGLVDPGAAGAAQDVVAHALERAAGSSPTESVAPTTTVQGVQGAQGRRGEMRTLLAEIAGYLGGALVVAAAGLFLAREWSRLSDRAQLLTLLAVTLLLLGAGLVVSRVGGGYAELRDGRDHVRRRLTSALLTAGALAAGVTVGRQVDILQDRSTSWPVLLGALAAVAVAAAAYGYAPSALGQVAMVAGGLTAVVAGWEIATDGGDSSLGPGLLILGLGVLWLTLAEAGIFREQVVSRSLAVALALLGAQMPAFDGRHGAVAYTALAAVAVLGFVLYLRTVAWPYLVAGVLGTTLAVPEAIIDWTEGSLGVAGGVLVAGLALLAASAVALRVKRETED